MCVQDIIKKIIRKDKLLNEDTWKYAKQECGIHEMVSNHNNVVKLYDQAENEKEFQMFMEYCDKGDYFADKINDVSQIPTYSLVQRLHILTKSLRMISNPRLYVISCQVFLFSATLSLTF